MADKQGFVITTEKSAEDFKTLLQSISTGSYLFAQQVDDIKLVSFSVPSDLDALLAEGRVFNEHFEIRYERLTGGRYELLVFYETPQQVEFLNLVEKPFEYERSDRYKIYLWGQARKLKDEWRFIEVRIPRILEYPQINGLGKDVEMILNACDYMTDAIPQFTRFFGLGVEKNDT
jgi:hypothetical protein